MHNSRPIMLIEDDDMDALVISKAFNELNDTNEVIRKVDGKDALQYLTDQSNQMPCFIILDLSMPRMNGLEFLKVVKADDTLKRIPVVLLTTSEDKQDIIESYELGAAGYVIKPVGYQQCLGAMRTINMYWKLSRIPDIKAVDNVS